ncbi:MAG: hypothetical protein QF473_27560 [Planctomycetota bacterium]|jgi:hypothetical protein|nr:hypothetical protein [Planctomycetota bacterium]MDP6502393.1 hypothetical protein [Planctomycetota bacterium]
MSKFIGMAGPTLREPSGMTITNAAVNETNCVRHQGHVLAINNNGFH